MFHCLVGIVVPMPAVPSWKLSMLQVSLASAYTEIKFKLKHFPLSQFSKNRMHNDFFMLKFNPVYE